MSTMSSSTLSIQPSLLDNKHSRDRQWQLADHGALENPSPLTASFRTTSFAANNLSPYSSVASSSTSPNNNASTPADSLSAYSEQYPHSDYSDQLDPLFGVDFDDAGGGTPSFLGDPAVSLVEDSSDNSEPYPQTVSSAPAQNAWDHLAYPISPPDPTPYIRTTSPRAERETFTVPDHASPKSFPSAPSAPSNIVPSDFLPSQLTPQSRSDTNTTSSSEEGPTSTTAPMPSPSPRVTVSMWGRDQVHGENYHPEYDNSPATIRAGGTSADDGFVTAPYQRTYPDRSAQESWANPSTKGRSGWAPESRPTTEGVSLNDLSASRKRDERNQEVSRWRAMSESGGFPDESPKPLDPLDIEDDGIHQKEIPLGSETENKPLAGQTYYNEHGGPLTEDDWKLMGQHRAWADAPTVYRINESERTQPETAQAAMQQFELMCQETGSVLSRAATWGTRRRSLPSIADMDGVTSGSFLKKLSISRDRKPSIVLGGFRNLMRKPSASQLLKRHRSVPEDEESEEKEPQGRRESRDTLAPPSRTSSWGKKPPVPSLNTALISMATGAAAIGTTHARTSSISNVNSPKSPFFRRQRSKTELPKGTGETSHSNLAGMWKKSGGPPVAQLARGSSAPDLDEEDDEDDNLCEEGDARPGSSSIIDDLAPNFAGFRQQVLHMNPKLAEQNTYLVDRIAHQQVVRYKDLLNKKIKHIQHTNAGNCSSGHMCVALGGLARSFDVKGESRGADPLSTAYEEGSDADGMPVEGAITVESFPSDIPMPPTHSLPAEFECQLCYSTKKFTKPSDWTKHVHEDVQPFTCTWDRCREPKIFKRKADWVRHENEGHRHLEWWTCDFEDCRHVCYRRDNFLQHLVREHKFPEPKVKTKAAIKKAGAQDNTWQKVEKCRLVSNQKPEDEPCRFCGKTLATWKKLTVHLAKHMENMSLPILRIVARKDLDADTIISPVLEPPPRNFPPVKSEPQPFSVSPNIGNAQALPIHTQSGLTFPVAATQLPYTHYPAPNNTFPEFYNGTVPGLQQPTLSLSLHQPAVPSTFTSQTGYQSMTGPSAGGYMAANQFNATAPQLEPFPAYSNQPDLHGTSENQMYDATVLNSSSFGGIQQQQQYSHRGSASPYTRSPNQGQGDFFHQQR